MPFYHRLGQLPPKRHTQFRRPDGALYSEELMSTYGFTGASSLLYHHHLPTQVTQLTPEPATPRAAWPAADRHHHLRTGRLPAARDPIAARTPLLFNGDLAIAVARPAEAMDGFFRNADGDELYFVHAGAGRLTSLFGELPFGPGDYLAIPRGTTYRLELEGEGHRFLVIE